MTHIIITATSETGIAAIKQHVKDTDKLTGQEQRQMKAVLSTHRVSPDFTSITMVPNVKIKTLLWVLFQGKMRKKDDLRKEWEDTFTKLMLENGATRDTDYHIEVEL